MEYRFNAVYQKDGDWWVAWTLELPGANTQGATLEEARENLKDAVLGILEANRQSAEESLFSVDVIREEISVEI